MSDADEHGYFGQFGGRFVPEVLVQPLQELEAAMHAAFADESFWSRYGQLLRDYVGRPSPLFVADRLSSSAGGATIVLKREDCNHTGAHKINNTIGQGLLALRMRKTRMIAETGAGQHGVATATTGALLGIPVEVYIGAEDARRQSLNVYLMKLLGATVRVVESGSRTLKDATSEAFRDWAASAGSTFYCIGSVVGAHPYPSLVKRFARVIGDEARAQCQERLGRLPDHVVACVGGGSNAIGIFAAFLGDSQTKLWGVEAAGRGLDSPAENAASLLRGTIGVLHGARTMVLQDGGGQVSATRSIAAGLDYPAVGPEHAHLQASGRVTYVGVDDRQALDAFSELARQEGIVPALESAHAIAHACDLARARPRDEVILVSCSGRGDKDAARFALGEPH
ncbi:MAG: tryptophan synthase subunit beta [Candidatus Eremiobacteraeota bacterium]|nr:tryptophan synthase subunit beta [Candidatus Eremiobacteraeota bacterium]MBC5826673.1 tryptophan synthase subunit beta [Candidatus Eremiobacteraeota bacterium]